MLHLLYILAFTTIAVLAIVNLVRSLMQVSMEARRYPGQNRGMTPNSPQPQYPNHPELVGEDGKPINEPLLVMRSVNVDEARQQLDALYNSSPGSNQPETREEN